LARSRANGVTGLHDHDRWVGGLGSLPW
jgi:hypothetical protein